MRKKRKKIIIPLYLEYIQVENFSKEAIEEIKKNLGKENQNLLKIKGL